MGQQQSRAVNKSSIVNDVVSNVLLNSSSNCSASSSANQVLSFSNIKTKGCRVSFRDIDQTAKITTNFTCSQDASNSGALASEFNAKLQAEVDAKVKGIGGALISKSDAETISQLTTAIKNNINVSQLSTCISDSMASQLQRYDKIEADCTGVPPPYNELTFNNIGQRLVATQAANCIQSQQAVAVAASKLDAMVDSKTRAATEGLDLVSMVNNLVKSVFGTLQMGWAVIGVALICVVLCCCVVLMMALTQGGASVVTSDMSIGIGRGAGR